MKTLKSILANRPVHNKVHIMNLVTEETMLVSEDEIRYIQTRIGIDINHTDYVIVDIDGSIVKFDKLGRLSSELKANTMRYNAKMSLEILKKAIAI